MDIRTVVKELERRGKTARPPGTILLELPLYGGGFAGRFRVLGPDAIEATADGMDEGSSEDNANAAAIFVADACKYIEAKGAGGKFEPVTVDGQRVRFDQALAGALGLEPSEESMAGVVRAAWTTVDEDGKAEFNAVALQMFSGRLLSWMQDTTRDVEGQVLGETQGGRSSSDSGVPQPSASTPASSSPKPRAA